MSVLKRIKNTIFQIAELVFVPKCAACFTALPSKDIPLCRECMEAYRTESKRSCARCGRPYRYCVCRIDNDGMRLPLVYVTSYDIRRSSVSRSMLLHLKDDRFDSAFDFLADDMLMALRERYMRLFERGKVVITYLPRSEKARRKSGHDQAEQIALRIAERSGAPLVPLFGNRSKKKQKKLDRAQRKENAAKGYYLLNPELRLDGRIVVLIDDIVTTGASVGACANLVKRSGAKAVIPLACARANSRRGLTESDLLDRLYG